VWAGALRARGEERDTENHGQCGRTGAAVGVRTCVCGRVFRLAVAALCPRPPSRAPAATPFHALPLRRLAMTGPGLAWRRGGWAWDGGGRAWAAADARVPKPVGGGDERGRDSRRGERRAASGAPAPLGRSHHASCCPRRVLTALPSPNVGRHCGARGCGRARARARPRTSRRLGNAHARRPCRSRFRPSVSAPAWPGAVGRRPRHSTPPGTTLDS
jgi:hypothetical protein